MSLYIFKATVQISVTVEDGTEREPFEIAMDKATDLAESIGICTDIEPDGEYDSKEAYRQARAGCFVVTK
jgi:hypothetical protein